MTGEEHYSEAERLLEAAKEDARAADRHNPMAYAIALDRANLAIAAAAVHADLAVAALSMNVAVCAHGTTGICMYCVIANDLLRAAS